MTVTAQRPGPAPAQPVAIADAVYQVEDGAGVMGANVLATLWRMISKYRARMWLAMALGTLSSLALIVPPVAAAMLTARLIAGDPAGALWWGGAMLAAALAAVVFFSAATMTSHLIAADVQADQRHKIGAKLKRVPLGVFSALSSVELRQLMIDDVEKIEDGVAHLIPEGTAAMIGPVMLLVLMLVVDWRLGVAAALPTIGGFILMSRIMQNEVEASNAFYRTQAGIAATMGEVVKAIPVIKTFNEGDAAIARADRAIDAFSGMVDDYVQSAMVPMIWFFMFATMNLILVTPVSIWLLSRDAVSVPEVVFFHLGAMSLALLVSGMFTVTSRLRTQEGVIARWSALMGQPDLPYVAEGKVPTGAGVRFEHVQFAYGEEAVIKGLSLDVPAGSSLALVGPSGAGKTTLARLLARFWDVSGGRITVGGVDIREISAERLAAHMSFVFQDVFLFSSSVADNIRIGRPEATDEEVRAAARAARADAFVSALPEGYDTVIGAKLGLSLGQKQRLSIARAILRDAPILVLDEATAFADPENEAEVQQAISALARDKTLIVIAHRLATIRNADQIAYIDGGVLGECGTHDELCALGGAYAAQWAAHTEARSFTLTNREAMQ